MTFKLSHVFYLTGAAMFMAAVFRERSEDKRELEKQVWNTAVNGKQGQSSSQPVTNG
jgi:hypothetical protein